MLKEVIKTSHGLRAKLVCDFCGKSFSRIFGATINQKTKKSVKMHFCDKVCYLGYHRQKHSKEVRCNNCGRVFRMRLWRWKKAKKFYCSWKCKKTSKCVVCEWCGRIFKRKPSVLSRHNFCSRACSGKWNSKYIRRENHPSWRGGWEPYYGPNWAVQKNKARRRDRYQCQICGGFEKERAHDVHHKRPFRKFGIKKYKLANKLSNLLTVCASCHCKIEARRKKKSGK